MTKKTKYIITSTILGLILISLLAFVFLIKPSNNRNWSLDQAILPSIDIKEEEVTIYNIRNFSYTSTTTYTPAYYDKTYRLDELVSVDYMVEPFEKIGAHTLVSFGFANGDYVSISAEIRKEVGETFSPWLGLLKKYELMYVIADERDVLQLRANHRGHEVYLYPLDLPKEAMSSLFLEMLKRADGVNKHPEFYNTLTNNCTTNIFNHLENLNLVKAGFDWRFILPEHSDGLVHELGLVNKTMSLSDLREQYRITDKSLKHTNSPDYSKLIREGR